MKRAVVVLLLLAGACGGSPESSVDAGRADAGRPPGDAALADASVLDAHVMDAGGLACPEEPSDGACEPATEFCYMLFGGASTRAAVAADASPPAHPGCNALPAECLADRTCACVMAHAASSCPPSALSCSDTDVGVVLTCSLP